jgi:predicted phosphodiesterase
LKLLIIGDVHGHLNRYYKTIQVSKPDLSIQVGDFGFQKEHVWHQKNLDSAKHKINFGNHDYYPMLDAPYSLGNHHVDVQNSIFSIRGAFSIDKAYRQEGLDWFREEELNMAEGDAALTAYKEQRPRIVVSHDGPYEVVDRWFIKNHPNWLIGGEYTRKLLQAMFEAHQPEQWFFGHHHESIAESISGTAFRCLNELESAWAI